MDAREGVVGKERVGPAAEREVMAHVARRLFTVHRWKGVAQCHALVERRKAAEM